MGVIGLWRLLDPTGKPVPLETLEGKVLAVDVSIWIHQALQGYQDGRGKPMPNAHLLSLFNRICKLLFYKIKPVFVFDGGVPLLKKSTIAARRKQKSIAASKAQRMKNDLINNLIKHTAVKTALSQNNIDVPSGLLQIQRNFSEKDDMFKLPDMPSTSTVQEYESDDEYGSDSSSEPSPRKQTKWAGNIHNVDVSTNEFKSLPADVRYDILTDLKETRKQNSWGRLHEMPEESDAFSGFQMRRLLKRRLVQESLESAEQEMGGKTLTLEELDRLLSEQGIMTANRMNAYRIASDSTSRLLYISDKNALKRSTPINPSDEYSSSDNGEKKIENNTKSSQLSTILENMDEYDFNDDWDTDVESVLSNESAFTIKSVRNNDTLDASDSEEDLNESHCLSKKYFGKINKNPALEFMLEYSGLSQKQIVCLINQSKLETEKGVKRPKQRKMKKKSRIKVEDRNDNAKASTSRTDEKQSTKLEELKDVPPPILVDTKDESEPNIVSSGSESDDLVEVTEAFGNDNISTTLSADKSIQDNKKYETNDNKINDTICLDATDSSSDDFVEVQDVPIPDLDIPNTNNTKGGLQIMINSSNKLEDDMFADIFENTDIKLDLPITPPKARQPTDFNIPSNNIEIKKKSNSMDNKQLEVIPEESIVTNTDEKQLKDELNKETVNNFLEVESSSKEISQKIVDTETAEAAIKSADDVEVEIFSAAADQLEDVKENPDVLPVDTEELLSLKGQLEDEQKELAGNIGKLERQATDITDQIRLEAQELLRLFGIPYVVAPMEAEAQCAYLEQIKLTDGTITDDSDIWLFGGQCVYRNFFNHNKRVLQFRSSDIQHHFKLSRHELIQLALLVGSDYTTGVTGIGPVTALEVLAAFPAEGENLLRGLMNFSTWMRSGMLPGPGRSTLRSKLRNVNVEKGFPSQAVVQAYLFPTIDDSKEPFSWGKPDLIHLGDYVKKKFGWTKLKFDEIMKPVIKRVEENKSQKDILEFFKLKAVPKSIEPSLSKRVQKAVQRIGGVLEESDLQEKEVDKKEKDKSTGGRIRKTNTKKVEEDSAIEVTNESNPLNASSSKIKNVTECIPQREKDRANALKNKLHAIEIFRKSRKGLAKAKKTKRSVRKVTKEAELSESSSSS